jgi:hypothetical protein
MMESIETPSLKQVHPSGVCSFLRAFDLLKEKL